MPQVSKNLFPKIDRFSDLKEHLTTLNLTNDIIADFTHFLQAENLSHRKQYRKNLPSAVNNLIEQIDIERFNWDIPFKPVENPKFTFIDLFAGIGGMRIAFQQLGGKCVFSSEWDKHSQLSYYENFGEMPFGDITEVNEQEVPKHEILVAGGFKP